MGKEYSTTNREKVLQNTYAELAKHVKPIFAQKVEKLIYVPAIREVRTVKGEDPKGVIDLSGLNLVKRLRQMQHPAPGKERDRVLFHSIEEAIQDLLGVAELEMEIQEGTDEIVLTVHGIRLPLSHYGTGIHELIVLCSTLMLHDNHIVCIEEPEIHLHPELLRKFVQFLAKTSNTYFIATHSNVLLDADETNVVYHVRHDGKSSHILRSRTDNETRAILRDLGYQASDLLQSNGIIWVEGPSDRIYINRWLELSGSKFIEGVHYSIMFYGGACLANLSATDCQSEKDFVKLLCINSNVVVVIDRDGDSPEEPLKEYKQRISKEVGADNCWITEGREIENYLPSPLLERFLKSCNQKNVETVTFGRDDKIDDCIKAAVQGRSMAYSSDKKGRARQICEKMTAEDIDCLNLKEWIARLLEAIGKWNAC